MTLLFGRLFSVPWRYFVPSPVPLRNAEVHTLGSSDVPGEAPVIDSRLFPGAVQSGAQRLLVPGVSRRIVLAVGWCCLTWAESAPGRME